MFLYDFIAHIADDLSKFGKALRSVDFTKKVGESKCSKNLGGKGMMSHYSRGHMVIVAPCGQIARSAALYTFVVLFVEHIHCFE